MSLIRVTGTGALPEYGSADAAGADLRAAETTVIPPGSIASVSTALRIELPKGCVGLIWPRSGLAARYGIDTLAGVIDADYRGEVKVVLANHGGVPFEIKPGDRIAQILVQRVERASFERAETLAPSGRGDGGFGSTGA